MYRESQRMQQAGQDRATLAVLGMILLGILEAAIVFLLWNTPVHAQETYPQDRVESTVVVCPIDWPKTDCQKETPANDVHRSQVLLDEAVREFCAPKICPDEKPRI